MAFKKEDLIIVGENRTTMLNSDLVKHQKLNTVRLNKIKRLHIERWKFIELMEETDNPRDLQFWAEQITGIDFALQKTWGFPQDRTYHKWFDLPKCTCPKIDNRERIGTTYGIISGDCPVHGGT